jgi:hypothetical protein
MLGWIGTDKRPSVWPTTAPALESAPPAECYPGAVDRETSKAIKWNSETPTFEDLAASQGVFPVTEFETLLGHPSAEDESADDFSAMLRAWRQKESARKNQLSLN